MGLWVVAGEELSQTSTSSGSCCMGVTITYPFEILFPDFEKRSYFVLESPGIYYYLAKNLQTC